MNIKNNYILTNKMLIIILTIILFIYGIRNINRLNSLMILPDEFGYWATGSYFIGRDWSGVTSELCPYYSYGYGLILSLFMKIVSLPGIEYQLAIIFNSLLLCFSFLVMRYIFSKLMDDKRLTSIFCFIACFYPSYIYNTQVAWSETLLFLIYCLTILFLYLTLVKNKIMYTCMFAILTVYLYTIHQRSLGIVILSITLMFYLAFKKIISIKKFYFYISIIIILFLIHNVIKNNLYINLWSNSQLNLLQDKSNADILYANDYKGQISKIKTLLSFKGIILFFISFLGKLFYAGLASFFMFYSGLKKIIETLKENKIEKNKSGVKKTIYLYIILSYFFTLIISSIFMIIPSRIDTIIYGRYTDWLIAPFIIVGIYNNYSCKENFKTLIYYLIFSLLFSLILHNYIIKNNMFKFYSSCSPMGQYFKENWNSESTWIFFMLLCIIIVALFFKVSIKFKNKYVYFIIIILLWCRFTNPAIEQTISISHIQEIKDILNCINKEENKTIYYLSNTENYIADSYIGAVQFWLGDISIKCVDTFSSHNINNSLVLISSEYISENYFINEHYTLISKNNIFSLYKIAKN